MPPDHPEEDSAAPARRKWRYPVGVGAALSALLAILLLHQAPDLLKVNAEPEAPTSAVAPPPAGTARCQRRETLEAHFDNNTSTTRLVVCLRSDTIVVTGAWPPSHPCAAPLRLDYRGAPFAAGVLPATDERAALLEIEDAGGARFIACTGEGLKEIPRGN